MQTHRIEFELLAFYFQEQNKLSKRKRQTFMKQVWNIIFGKNILDNLWAKILLAIKHMSNLVLTSAYEALSLYDASKRKSLIISNLPILGSTVYVFIYKEKRKTKSVKLKLKRKRDILVRYNGHILHWIYLVKDEKVIWIKDSKIFEDIPSKDKNRLPIYNSIFYFGKKDIHIINLTQNL